MMTCDALVVGGGPAGSTCAGALTRAGWNVVVVDRAAFPRDKVCAGWVTPEVFTLLSLDPGAYRSAGLTLQSITAFRTSVLGDTPLTTTYPGIASYAIRRCEFDAFLLKRSGARVLQSTPVVSLHRDQGRWIVNEAVAAPYLIAAGGHFCPVARHLRGERVVETPVVAKEAEFRASEFRASGAEPPELFFCRDFQGYGWCVPKGPYLNVGMGRRSAVDFNRHVEEFVAFLTRHRGLGRLQSVRWRGHAYLARGADARPIIGPAVLAVGDAAGLAYPESGEGIRPAIESGLLAAEALIAAGGRLDVDALEPYALALQRRHPPATTYPPLVQRWATMAGRQLFRSSAFTRHVVLDRWFLRREGGRFTRANDATHWRPKGAGDGQGVPG